MRRKWRPEDPQTDRCLLLHVDLQITAPARPAPALVDAGLFRSHFSQVWCLLMGQGCLILEINQQGGQTDRCPFNRWGN